ncbi:MAG TPA: class II aldolase/adducin family protein [Thermoanaerobaculia bacterium]|nr:class II aldolase/adducin family protein [Thermoanaerobaculia bacterium]
MRDRFADIRYDVWLHARKMWEAGLVAVSSGNVSRRVPGEKLIAITPTSISYDDMSAAQIAIVDLATGESVESKEAPSYELPMHRVIYKEMPHVAAIVHTHSPFVTTLSVLRRPLPAVIDEMAVHFGGTIDVAEYAFTGTDELGQNVVRALGDRPAALLANHGNVCVAADLAKALKIAVTMEAAARVYFQAQQIGEPVRLPDSAVEAGREMFRKRKTDGA